MKFLVLLSLFTVAFAGCTDSGDEGTQGVIEDESDLATGMGAINGLLIDDVYRPIPEAAVFLFPLGIERVSSINGEFQFADLVPGDYEIRIQADGYEATIQPISVVAGEFTDANVEARRIVSNDGATLTAEYNIFQSCGFNAVVIATPLDCTADSSGDTSRESFEADYSEVNGTTWLVTEIKTNQVLDFELRIRPPGITGPSGNYAVGEIVQGDYLKIVHENGVVNTEAEVTGGNVAWNNTGPIQHVLYVDSLGKHDPVIDGFGAGAYFGVKAKIVQTLFLGEPAQGIDPTTYCVLCEA